ncbi:MAG: hypothetical protein PHS62_01450 [Patescibacteria group bacterium]|nr:hypothetical protein [Patescibacteria group bacterium]
MALIKPGNKIEKPSYNPEHFKGPQERTGQSREKETRERLEEARKSVIEVINQAGSAAPASIGPVTGIMAPQAKQQKQIEKVLASGLDDIYLSLTPEKQEQFKRAGEETAGKINKLLSKTKVKLGAIVKLIRKWLSLIPGVSKYFLEQEAKIKADEIIKLKHE